MRERVNVESLESEDRRHRGRRVRPGRRVPALRGGPRGRRLRALARAGRPGGDDRRRRRAPARALLPPPVHHRPPHRARSTRSSGCRTSSSGGRRASRCSPTAASGRSRRRWTCCGSARCRRSTASGWALAVLGAAAARQRPGAVRADHRARVDREADGARRLARGVGPDAARQVRRPCGRHRDGVDLEQAAAAAWGGRARGAPRLPAALVGAPVRGAGARDRVARRARADRPAGDPHQRRPGGDLRRARLVPRRARPARVRTGRRRALRPRARHRAERRLRPGSPGLPRSPPIEYFAALCLLLELDRQFSDYYWTNVADRDAAVRRPDRAHELHRARALRRPPLPLRRQLPRARPRAARPRRRRAAGPLPAGPAQGQPGVRPRVGQEPLAAPRARRAADRHRRLPRAHPAAARRRSRASCSPTPRRSIPRTAGPTTPSGSATRPRRPCCRECAGDRRRRDVHGRGAGHRGRDGHREGAEHRAPGGGRGRGGARGAAQGGRRTRRRGALRPRLDGRHQRAPDPQPRPHRARHHEGVPRHPVPRPPGPAEPVPPARGADAAGGRAPPLRRGRRADGA